MNGFPYNFKTWIELDSYAAKNNCLIFRKIINKKSKLFAVVKSNAYGHGILDFPKIIEKYVDGFCVDSIVESEKLRNIGIKKDILVLGPTLPNLYFKAVFLNASITISNFCYLNYFLKLKYFSKIQIHIKIDTGMHRQGFLIKEIPNLIKIFKKNKFKIKLLGIYTHFADANDLDRSNFTEFQFKEFKRVLNLFRKNGFKNFIAHCASTGGTLINKKYHLDICRVGIGLYGYFPSTELELKLYKKIDLKPVLNWKTIISEIKYIKKGSYVGYNLTWMARRDSKIAILPIGYWHGIGRIFSNMGFVLINNKKAPIIGTISMDFIICDITDIEAKIGDLVIIIGKSKNKEIKATDLANISKTSHYEFLTRINPLIYKIIK